MIISFLKFGFNFNINEITIYEDDTSIDLEESEERVKTLREEILKSAPDLKEIYTLFKKG
jgi:hypothetical protein